MPPKRKRAEETASVLTTRATRSSARNKASAVNVEAGPSGDIANGGPAADGPPGKKTKKAPAKTSKKAVNAKGQSNTPSADHVSAADVPPPSNGNDAHPEHPPPSNGATATAAKSKPEPYSATRAADLFRTYADPDDASVIDPEGFERLCSDADVPLEGALPLILAWQLSASEMAKITKGEWEKGTAELQISNLKSMAMALRELEDLLLLGKPPVEAPAAAPLGKNKNKKSSALPPDAPYNRTRYYSYAADKKKAFSTLYGFCFTLARQPAGRNIDMETACAFWSVLVAPQYPITTDIIAFINDKGSYKGVNKDLWSMMLEFCETISPNLDNFEAEGAWPTLLDEFVEWKKAQGLETSG